ncbi:MAG: tRNA glutamyl-Q(34) synthetase GluQRS [Acidobacteria bacterium]|nr:tRNA glutamyl-Q(34) synthetase GluQRS [Acidobacteriota bacterium]MCB9397080.1 tRNA glutamyl-Q(34) synthetase GluQRS [Acidobacteriota bacterium]
MHAAAVGRYAPSPTGPLHLGNLQTALAAWLQARLAGGRIVLRMEDLDTTRSQPIFREQILEDLAWLGLDWDAGPQPKKLGPFDQTQRTGFYDKAFQDLEREGLIYPCSCSRKDIAEAAGAPHGYSPIYPGTCRSGPRKGGPWAWRIRVPDQVIGFEDQVIGWQSQNVAASVGDFVIRRADGVYAYQLAVVVDDAAMEVSDVVRGQDLLDSTARQVYLQRVLGYPQPTYWHVPLRLDENQQKMSKRDGSQSLGILRDQGIQPEQVIADLADQLGLEPTPQMPKGILSTLDLTHFRTRLQEKAASTPSC